MQSPFFSVIIPTYNRAAYIVRTIQSVLRQTYSLFEVIIVDDGSTDNTEEIVKSIQDNKIKYYKKKNEERGAARNYGMGKASGTYFTFLDSDDILYTDYLANAYEAIQKLHMPLFFHQAYEITDEYINSKTKVDYLRSDDLSIFIKGNPLSCMGVFLHQSIVHSFKFNENRDLSGSEDWELWIRIAANVGIKTDNRVAAALIDHNKRSVVNYDEEKLRMRKELALQYAFEDKAVQKKFGNFYKQIVAYWDTYIALHLVLSKKNKAALKYLKNAFTCYPPCIFERRFAAIIKHAILNFTK